MAVTDRPGLKLERNGRTLFVERGFVWPETGSG
jgi:hypothetical protein